MKAVKADGDTRKQLNLKHLHRYNLSSPTWHRKKTEFFQVTEPLFTENFVSHSMTNTGT